MSAHAVTRCAGCLSPFAERERKIVADTEVFHERCLELVPKSLTNKLKRRVIDLSAKVRILEIDARDAAHLRISIDEANAEARRTRAERDRLERELREARDARTTAERSSTYFQSDIATLRRVNEALTARAEAAEREAALHQTIQGARASQAPAIVTTTQATADPHPGKDDTEIRFSLLELDPQK